MIIAFGADPDIRVVQQISENTWQKIIAIEIKGGGDKSNIWNRLGEAEKSHQTAKAHGFTEFWTIYNVSTLDRNRAKEKSPTTNRFFSLSEIVGQHGDEFVDFRDRLIALVGIRGATRS